MISLEFPSSKFELQTIFRGLKTEATFEDTRPAPPTPEELEEKAKIRQAQFEAKCKEDPEYLQKCLEHQENVKQLREMLQKRWKENPDALPNPNSLANAINAMWNDEE